jgi:hypothetical protein
MNPYCDECGVPSGAQIIRQASGDGWLKLGHDCHYYGATGGRYRMADLPEEYVDSPLVRARLDIVLDVGTPRCLCQHCAEAARRRKQPRVTAR